MYALSQHGKKILADQILQNTYRIRRPFNPIFNAATTCPACASEYVFVVSAPLNRYLCQSCFACFEATNQGSA